jgi:hypothetical protein
LEFYIDVYGSWSLLFYNCVYLKSGNILQVRLCSRNLCLVFVAIPTKFDHYSFDRWFVNAQTTYPLFTPYLVTFATVFLGSYSTCNLTVCVVFMLKYSGYICSDRHGNL